MSDIKNIKKFINAGQYPFIILNIKLYPDLLYYFATIIKMKSSKHS